MDGDGQDNSDEDGNITKTTMRSCSECHNGQSLLVSPAAPRLGSPRYRSNRLPRSTPPSTLLPTHYSANRSAEDLEDQNEVHIKGLADKVKLLKQVTLHLLISYSDCARTQGNTRSLRR